MFKKLLDSGYKELKRCEKIAKQVFAYDDEISKLTDEELQAKTPYFKELLKNGTSSFLADKFEQGVMYSQNKAIRFDEC